MNSLSWLIRIALITAIFASLVIALGAFTRLTDAGLGCPDWPGCYGHFAVPAIETNIPMDTGKAWAEMIHRYFAGILALLVILTAALASTVASRYGLSFLVLGMLLFGLIIYQAILGMWTVTLKLFPMIVTQHLLGGMITLALLWLLYLKSAQTRYVFIKMSKEKINFLRIGALLGLILIFLQIALGAWTSTHYAGISIPTWHADFHTAFNYKANHLSDFAKMTIHMTHRYGALIVGIYLLLLTAGIYWKKRSNPFLIKIVNIMLALLIIQIILGISNIVFSLPLVIAIAHTLCAALLLLSLITLNFIVFSRPTRVLELPSEAMA